MRTSLHFLTTAAGDTIRAWQLPMSHLSSVAMLSTRGPCRSTKAVSPAAQEGGASAWTLAKASW